MEVKSAVSVYVLEYCLMTQTRIPRFQSLHSQRLDRMSHHSIEHDGVSSARWAERDLGVHDSFRQGCAHADWVVWNVKHPLATHKVSNHSLSCQILSPVNVVKKLAIFEKVSFFNPNTLFESRLLCCSFAVGV